MTKTLNFAEIIQLRNLLNRMCACLMVEDIDSSYLFSVANREALLENHDIVEAQLLV